MKETVIERRVTSINKGVMVVTKRQRAVQVEDDIAVSVFEKVTLGLLKVNEVESLLK